MDTSLFEKATSKPLFDPTFINPDYFYGKILNFFHTVGQSNLGVTVRVISYLMILFGITIIIFCIVRIVEIQKDEHAHLKHEIDEAIANKKAREEGGRNTRWDHIQELIHSDNPGDWRLAIIEADTVLEGLLKEKDIPGNGIGEKLKNLAPGDLVTLQSAWEAHLLRNKIAHEGSGFDLSIRDAKKAIGQFEIVFRELGFL